MLSLVGFGYVLFSSVKVSRYVLFSWVQLGFVKLS